MNAPLLVLATGAILAGMVLLWWVCPVLQMLFMLSKPAPHAQNGELSNKEIKNGSDGSLLSFRAVSDTDTQIINLWSRSYFWHDAIFVPRGE